ncbi:hypothetical protein DPX16_4984 [Anabarilius grahami]|uniref:USP domain-containing protein n=1 Tax=Anabarilius grahami TaxID=495550 RepID=A0A3N0YCW7_ANAGA|nr:hypothetical protein DPX16_4984 [Anabarilius grahami]
MKPAKNLHKPEKPEFAQMNLELICVQTETSFVQQATGTQKHNESKQTHNIMISNSSYNPVSSRKYELYAIVKHKVKPDGSGHYYVDIECGGGNWYRFDDESVSKTPSDEIPPLRYQCYFQQQLL